MLPGFSTNSLGDTDPFAALPLLAELGCRSLAITPDRQLLNPFAEGLTAECGRWRQELDRLGLACVIETGARHLLDPLRKHEPTLVSSAAAERDRRRDFLCRAIDLAAELQAGCVSLWAGVVHDAADQQTHWQRLVDGLGPVLDHAGRRGVTLGFEPEPGMFIDTVARAEQLLDRLGRPPQLGLTIDIGHLECLGERPLAATVARVAGRVVNVHIDDMLVCRHEHLPLGAGEVDFEPALRELARAGYRGGLHIELPRQSHRWLATAGESLGFLTSALRAIDLVAVGSLSVGGDLTGASRERKRPDR